jgi:hypothetical protein
MMTEGEPEHVWLELPKAWPCDHDVPPTQLRKARRSMAPYCPGGRMPAALSAQFLTAWAAFMGMAGGIECRWCQHLIVQRWDTDPEPPELTN